MRLARVVGTVTGTVKDRGLVAHTLLLVNLVDAAGTVTDSDLVAVDAVGAGNGDLVLVAAGSAARQAQASMSVPTDLTIVAIVDEVTASADTTRKERDG